MEWEQWRYDQQFVRKDRQGRVVEPKKETNTLQDIPQSQRSFVNNPESADYSLILKGSKKANPDMKETFPQPKLKTSNEGYATTKNCFTKPAQPKNTAAEETQSHRKVSIKASNPVNYFDTPFNDYDDDEVFIITKVGRLHQAKAKEQPAQPTVEVKPTPAKPAYSNANSGAPNENQKREGYSNNQWKDQGKNQNYQPKPYKKYPAKRYNDFDDTPKVESSETTQTNGFQKKTGQQPRNYQKNYKPKKKIYNTDFI